jgi:hypothetical protein
MNVPKPASGLPGRASVIGAYGLICLSVRALMQRAPR